MLDESCSFVGKDDALGLTAQSGRVVEGAPPLKE
jgi:hypothetical protein